MSRARRGKRYKPSKKQRNNLDRLHSIRRGKRYSTEEKRELSKRHLLSCQEKRDILSGEAKQKELDRLEKAKKFKPILCIEKNLKFKTIRAAGIYFNIHPSAISQVLSGKQTCAAGYTWRYLKKGEY